MDTVLRILVVLLLLATPAHAAFTITLMEEGSSNTDTQTYTTGSFTMTSGYCYFAFIATTRGSGTAGNPSITGWVAINNTLFDGTGKRITALRTLAASTVTGTVTISVDGTTNTSGIWQIVEVQGADTTGTNCANAVLQDTVNMASSNVTSLTVTLGAFSSVNNGLLGGFAININSNITAGSGLTGFSTNGVGATAPANHLNGVYKTSNDTTVDMSDGSGKWGAIAFELVLATAVAAGPNLRRLKGVGQ